MSSTASGTDVTILMPTLNAAAFIDEALSSIQSSDLAAQKRVEVLLLDGGSTDRTLEVARRYEPLIRANVEKDGGLYAALSRGLAMAQGEIVGWLNADDTFTKDGALRVVDALSADPSLDLAYGDYLVVREGSAPELRRQADEALSRFAEGALGALLAPLTMFWRRRALVRLGGWVSSYRIVGDEELWIRATALRPALRVGHVDTVVGSFRVHPGSLSSGEGYLERVNREDVALYRQAGAYEGLPPGLARSLRGKRRELVMWFAGRHWKRGHLRTAYRTIRDLAGPEDGVATTVAIHLLESMRWRIARAGKWVCWS
jgi:glycosyltransferase involved in cell wall biosynthesis